MVITLNKTTNVVDNNLRPIVSGLTVAQVGQWLAAHHSEIPAYLEATFSTVGCAPVSVDAQITSKLARLRAIGRIAGLALRADTLTRNGSLCRVLFVK